MNSASRSRVKRSPVPQGRGVLPRAPAHTGNALGMSFAPFQVMSQSNCATRSFGLWLAVAALGVTGCYAHARAEPVFVEADYTPVHLDIYPHTVYEGRVVYLVNDHWYTRDRGRWVYYRVEPTPLYRQRVVVRQAPRAPVRHAPGGPRAATRTRSASSGP